MVYAVFFCCAMVGDQKAPATRAPSDLAIYQTAKKETGRDADAHVRLALWCEAHGLSAERAKHLALAILYDPANALARGLTGLVSYKGKWGRPETIGKQIQTDPERQALLREYFERRAKTASKPDAQSRLAAWCEEKGLKDEAVAHYNEVLRLDPTRESAWRHLGYKKAGNRWVKPDDLAAEKREAEIQKRADKQWKPKLEKVRDGLESKDPARRARAEKAMAEVTDPRAVPMIWTTLITGSERLQVAAVQILGQIDGPVASTSLAALAVFNPSGPVRGRAIQTLTRRDPRDVVDRLIGMIRKPFKYQVRLVNGSGSPGELFVEGEKFNVRRLYTMTPVDPNRIPMRIFTSDVPFDPFSNSNLMMAAGAVPGATIGMGPGGQPNATNPQNPAAAYNQMLSSAGIWGPNPATGMVSGTLSIAAQRDIQIGVALEDIRQRNNALQQRLAMDIQAVEATNAQIRQLNDRALPVLKATTSLDLGAEPEKWKSWWTDQLGYAYQSSQPDTKPTFTDMVVMPSTPPSSACFAAGTSVQTVEGPRAIELIQVGDRVLSQNTSTGMLGFQPVVAVHRNKPAATLRVSLGGETIVATGIHRFWKAGKGWTMARELKPGDRLRILGGLATVHSIETAKIQPVYNLDVAENRDFLVGAQGILVHDFSFVQPVLAPFDREPEQPAHF
ncbi:MAG: polymorphic toxin-type HINT domain-containing protein [Isosphaeraceae bacterium]